MKKLFLALSVMSVFLLACTKERKVCSPVGEKMVCQLCTCPQGDAIAGLGGAACPDGAKPTCKVVEE